MPATKTTNIVRWTPNRIRKALLCPKPQHAIAKAASYHNGGAWRSSKLDSAGLRLLQHIAEHADILNLPVPDPLGLGRNGGVWLLVALPQQLLDKLSEWQAELADLEADADPEPEETDSDQVDDEPQNEDVDESDTEESLQPPIMGEISPGDRPRS